jgi:hypothetical protein
MEAPTFKDSADKLCLTTRELASLFGLTVQTMKQCRMKPGLRGYRAPPAGWEKKLAVIARKKGGELVKLAKALEVAAEG